MAKISSYGDYKLREWKDGSGCRLVLTAQGRVLRNYLKGDSLTAIGGRNKHRAAVPLRVEQYAAKHGFVEVAS